MRIPFIAGNWKMYKTVQEAVVFAKELRRIVKDVNDVEIVIAPPFTAVHAVAEALRNANVGVAAQDLYWEREGAFTGEVSAHMIKEAGAEFVIVGHSERRRLFGETDRAVNRKVVAAIAAGLTGIVCVGETLEERERSETLAAWNSSGRRGTNVPSGRSRRSPAVTSASAKRRHSGPRISASASSNGPSAAAHSRCCVWSCSFQGSRIAASTGRSRNSSGWRQKN